MATENYYLTYYDRFGDECHADFKVNEYLNPKYIN
jgi:hypothetical protein